MTNRQRRELQTLGGQMRYVTVDNRDFLLALVRELEKYRHG
jgi:hypothetical protein